MSFVYNFYTQGRLDLLTAKMNLLKDSFKVCLLKSNYVFNNAHLSYEDIAPYEIAAVPGYLTSGQLLTNQNLIVDPVTGSVSFHADDLLWTATSSTIGPAYHAVLYDATIDALLLDFTNNSANFGSSGSSLSIQWNPSGIFVL